MEAKKAQAAIEFLITYGWAIIILTIMIYFLYRFVTTPNSLVPSSCQMDDGLLCQDIILGTNTINHQVYVYVSEVNQLPYPLQNVSMRASIRGANTTYANCTPSNVDPGGTITCLVNRSSNVRFYQTLAGSIFINASYCGLVANYLSTNNCTGAPRITLTGGYIGHAQPYSNITSLPTSGLIYCVGGTSYYTSILLGGGLGNWTTTTPYPITLTNAGCDIYDGYAYCVGSSGGGGGGGHVTNLTYYAPRISSGLGNWTATTPYPVPLAVGGCSAYKGYMYCVGDDYDSELYNNADYYAPISASGIGQWKNTTQYAGGLHGAGDGATCTITNGFIYCINRHNGASVKPIYYAPVSSTGIGAWTFSQNYPMAVGVDSCISANGGVYCVGNDRNKPSYYAPIAANGSLGTFVSTTKYPTNFWGTGCTTHNKIIYCLGDHQGNKNMSYYAPISGSSGIGNWIGTTNSPLQQDGQYCSMTGDSGGLFG